MKQILTILATALISVGIFAVGQGTSLQDALSLGSVSVGNQYQATTTPQVADATNLCPARIGMASSTTGVLGSVNVTVAGTGALTLYDATTTNASLRGNIATSSLILADFTTTSAVGSYHFDVEFKNGLLVDYTTAGTGVPTTTISYRCEG